MKQGDLPEVDVKVSIAAARGAALLAPGQAEESERWLRSLQSDGLAHEEAVAKLHALLLRAARFELGRRAAMLSKLSTRDREDLALQAADDALMNVLKRLESFEGRSRFTTWAYKFAVYEAAVKARRRSWQGREVSLETAEWSLVADTDVGPERSAEQREMLAALEQGIRSVLTAHQRNVLVALALTGVPVDVLAERLGTTRGALYKTLHDGRRKLRAHLTTLGLAVLTDDSLKEKR